MFNLINIYSCISVCGCVGMGPSVLHCRGRGAIMLKCNPEEITMNRSSLGKCNECPLSEEEKASFLEVQKVIFERKKQF